MAKENPFLKNHASNSKLCEDFLSYVAPILTSTRTQRRTLEAKWLADTQLWSCVLDNMGFVGRSNLFVPELHNQIENSAEKMVAATFTNPEAIQAIPMPGTSVEQAKAVQEIVAYELLTKNKFLTRMDEFERAKVLYGTSIMKGRFESVFREIWHKDPETKRTRKVKVPTKLGAFWDAVSIFRFYIYPVFGNLENYEIIFEDALVSKRKLKNDKQYLGLDEVHYPGTDLEHLWVDVELMDMADINPGLRDPEGDKILLTEIFTEFDLGDGVVPVQAFIGNNNKVLRLVRNQFWWQDHNYVGDVYVQRPNGLFYGLSLPDKIRSQQYQMNDTANHTMDSLNYSLSPITVIDPALAGDVNSMKSQPGAKWLGSPEGIEMRAFPDVSGAGLRVMQEVRGQIAQFSDNSPGLAPQLEGKARSATQASIVQSSVSTRQRVQGGREEENVLVPMCKKTHILLQQFMNEDWIIKTAGAAEGQYLVKNVKPENVVGDVDFFWKGTSYSEKNAVRSQQLMGLLQMGLKIAALMPGEIDVANLFKKIAMEAHDIRGLDEIFKSLRDKKSVDPEVENMALKLGEPTPVNNGDDDQHHIEKHMPALDDPDLDDETKMNIINHIETHNSQLEAKKKIIQLKAKAQVMQQLGPPDGGGSEGGGQAPGMMQPPPNPMEGNSMQMSNSPADVMTGNKGVQV